MEIIIPNGHKIYQHLPFKGPSKIYPNWGFWFENKPSGNPASKHGCKTLDIHFFH
jgi:hypothetical protein